MRTFALSAAVAGIWLLTGTFADTRPSAFDREAGLGRAAAVRPAAMAPAIPIDRAPSVSPSIPAASLTDVVQRYCVTCHNDQLLTGTVSLQGFDVERAAEQAPTAERMIRKLRAGMMPPPGMPRPAGDTLAELVETLESIVDRAAAAAPNLGMRRFQRITRVEYGRVIHDLLALDVDAGKWLAPDILVGAFDNASAGQPLSTTLLASYMTAASEVSWLAIGNPEAASATTKYRSPAEVSQHAWDRLEGAPFGTRCDPNQRPVVTVT